MPTLEEQLEEIKLEEKRVTEKYPFFNIIEPKLAKVENRSWNIAIVIDIIAVTIFFSFIAQSFYSWKTLGGILFFSLWPGAFIAMIAQIFVESFLEYLIFRPYNLNKHTYNTIKRESYQLKRKKSDLDTKIKSEKNKAKESLFQYKLNDAVYKIENRKISIEEALLLKKELEQENKIFVTDGYYYYTKVYYNNRFEKINEALRKYNEPIISTPKPTETKISEPIYKPKAEPPVVTEKKVEPFSPAYKPIVSTNIPVAKTEIDKLEKQVEPTVKPVTNEEPVVKKIVPKPIESRKTLGEQLGYKIASIKESIFPKRRRPSIVVDKPIVKVEPPIVVDKPKSEIASEQPAKNDKPVIKAEPSVIKENAGKTAETPMEELYSDTESLIKVQSAKQYNESLKIDYKKLYEKKQHIGIVGEIFAFEWEKRRLLRNGLSIDKLMHVSLTNDTLGYDILSMNDDGTTRFIEVKTTTGSSDTSFFMSESEKIAMEKLENYYIYRLYYFDIEKGVSAITILDKKKGFDKYFNFQPISYRVSPKRS